MHAFSFPHRIAKLAGQVETWGFGGLLVADSQNLNADVWVELALAGAATQRIRLGTGVTNPVTRHPSVTASAALTLHEETGGRAVLGLGRGDSAVRQIGRKPVSPGELQHAVRTIQDYLRGRVVDFNGFDSRLSWVGDVSLPKVPVGVAATGPQVISVAARYAEQVHLTVGAEPERLRWAVDTAKAAAGDRPVSLGAFLNVAVHPNRAVARDLVRGSVAIFARFAAEGAPADGLSDVTRAGIRSLGATYDESRHGHANAPHARQLEDDFIDRFALVGTAEEVLARLDALAMLGLERIIIVPGSVDADPALVAECDERFAAEVLPQLADLGQRS